MRLIRENLVEKILAFSLTVFLWAAVRGQRDPVDRQVLDVPLELRNLPDAVEVVAGKEKVRFVLRGHPQELRRLEPATLAPYVDLGEARPGRQTFPIYYQLPGDVELDLNPVKVMSAGEGCWVVDARIMVR